MLTKSIPAVLASAFVASAHAAPPIPDPLNVKVVNTPLAVTLDDTVYRVGLQVGWYEVGAPSQVVDAYATVTFPGPVVIEQVSGSCGDGVLAAFLSLPALEQQKDYDMYFNGVTVEPQVGLASWGGFGLVPLPIQQTPEDLNNIKNWIAPVLMKLRVHGQVDVRVRKPQLYTGTRAWCSFLLLARPAKP